MSRASLPRRPYGRNSTVKTKGYLSEVFVSFQGEGAHVGRRHLFVRLAGCNIRCRYCDTPDSLERTAGYTIWDREKREDKSNPVSPEDLGRIIKQFVDRDRPIDAIALTGGEPLVQADFLATALSTQDVFVPVLLETNGVLPNKLAEVLPFIDIISMDLKLPSNSGEGGFWDEHAAFLDLGRGKDLYIKIVVDQTTDSGEIETACRLVAAHVPEAATFLQPMTGLSGGVQIDSERLAEFYAIGRSYLKHIRVLPQTHKAMGIM